VDGLSGVADLVPAGDIADDGSERLGSGVGGDGGVMNEDDGCSGSSTGSALLGVVADDDDDDDNGFSFVAKILTVAHFMEHSVVGI